MNKESFHDILALAIKECASDLIFAVGHPPIWKFSDNKMFNIKAPELSASDTAMVARYVLDGRVKDFEDFIYKDVSYDAEGIGRFRASICKTGEMLRVVMRVIPNEIRTFADLNLPAELEAIARLPRGLVLVTGAAGQGKSTTLSVMLDYINRNQQVHIVTIEDPVEFVYCKAKSLITQRQVGEDALDYKTALREALRLSPNIIMLSEIRDKETFETALEAAETGHLVLSAIHTPDAVKTFQRVLGFYNHQEWPNVRDRLSYSLAAIISLRLLDQLDPNLGIKRIPAVELLRNNSTISSYIRDGKTAELISQMEKGWDIRERWTFDQYIFDLYLRKLVKYETALENATNPGAFETRKLEKTGMGEPGEAPAAAEAPTPSDPKLQARY